MPSPSDIVEGLRQISHQWWGVALAWHVLLGLSIAAVGLRLIRPSARLVAVSTALPLASVSLFAWIAGNPFNGTVFGLGSVALVATGLRASHEVAHTGPRWAIGLGALMIAFGWFYPHFLETRPLWYYAFAAPLGLIPCPTLSVVLGVALCCGLPRAHGYAFTAGALGLFYGLFGVLRLGVFIDLPLIAAAFATLVLTRRSLRPSDRADHHGRAPANDSDHVGTPRAHTRGAR